MAVADDSRQEWLAHVPVPLFASVMGLSGLGLAWRRAAHDLGWPSVIGEAILLLAALAFAALALSYAAKALRYPGLVAAEFNHPIRSSFFAAITIGAMLLSVAASSYAPAAGEIAWMIASAAHLAVALAVFRQWFAHNIDIRHSNPAWFIPVVGNIVAPLGAAVYGYVEIGWFFFAVGVTFWLVLFPIILNRIIFHDQLPAKFMPTLVILLAPPSVSFLSYLGLNDGQIDGFARILFFVAVFTAMLIAVLSSLFVRTPFALSWWAYTFPSAAFALASIRYHAVIGGPASALLAQVLLIVATIIVSLVLARTLIALVAGKLFVPEN